MNAVLSKHVECARALLPATNPLLTNRAGETALHTAVRSASEACFELLLPVYDVDVRTVPGVDPATGVSLHFSKTALHLACQTGQLQMCNALLSRGADRMARDSQQAIPLHYAAANGHLSCVIKLAGRPGQVRMMTPTEVGAVTDIGESALHCAARHGSHQVCHVLLTAGARLDAKTSYGFTPLMLAQHHHPTNAALHSLLSGDGPVQPLELVCDHCGQTAEEASVQALKVCRGCQDVRYCGGACQTAAWEEHRAACEERAKEREEMTRVKLV